MVYNWRMKKYLLLLLCLFGCAKQKESHSEKPLILLSVEPYVSMVEEIAGDSVIAKCVLPAYVDPHNWEPRQRDLTDFEHARIWFTIGEGFESPLLKKLKTVNAKLKAVSLSQNFERLTTCDHHHHGCSGIDTHYWLDPILDIKQAKVICDSLSLLIPEKKDQFEKNYTQLRDKLIKLDEVFQTSLKPLKNKILVTSHGAYTYFCKRYHITQFVIEPDEGKEPRPKDLTHLLADLKTHQSDIIGIFTQPQHSNKAAKILAEVLSVPMYSVDPYKKNYIETMVLLETYMSGSHATTTH